MLRYPGGKSRAVKKLAPLIPSTTQHVIAPFLGGGSFELYLTGQGITVEASDLFPQLVTFWQVMQSTPDALADRLDALLGTVDKTMFATMQHALRTKSVSESAEDALDVATWFYAVNRCSFSGATLSGGFSRSASVDRFTQSSVDRVRNFHNHLLTVDHRPYQEALQHDADLYFLDPPYLLGGSRDSLYGDRGSMHDSFDHVAFRDLVKDLRQPALITYNNDPTIRELWEDAQWTVHETSWSYGMNASKQSSEVIILNYPIPTV